MPQLIVMDRTGDSRMSFTTDPAAVTEDVLPVQAAMDRFKELMGQGYTAVAEVNGVKTIARKFPADAEKVIMMPQYIGG